MKNSRRQIESFARSAQILGGALAHLDRAAALVAPRGRKELEFLRNKTASYRMLLDTLITSRRGYLLFDEAFRIRRKDNAAEFRKKFDGSMALFSEVRRKGRATTEKFAGFVDHPSRTWVRCAERTCSWLREWNSWSKPCKTW